MSISYMKMHDKEIDPLELSKKVWRPLVTRHPRLRSRIVSKFGELFFEELDIEDVLKYAFTVLPEGKITNEDEIGMFVDSQVGS
jgi:hypothetical protein